MTSSTLDNYLWFYVLMAGLSFFSLFWVSPRFGFAAGVAILATLGSALWTYLSTNNRYVRVNVYDQMAIRYFAADSLAKGVLILFPLMLFVRNRYSYRLIGEVCSSTFVFVSSLVLCYQAVKHGCFDNACGGLLGNPSISVGLMMCMLPVAIHHWRRQFYVLIPAVVAAFLSGSSIVLGLLGVYCGVNLWRRFNYKLLPMAIGFAAVLGAGRLALGSELTNDSDRFRVWKFMFHSWNLPVNWTFGTGLGSYHVLSINLQNAWGKSFLQGTWWNTLHNDWLQLLFECGIVGLLSCVFVYLTALAKLWREGDYSFLLSLLLFGMYMFLDPALHDPIPALFGAWLIVYALFNPKRRFQ